MEPRLRQQHLLILDLNGVLVLAQHHRVPNKREDARANKKFVYFRPHLERFLRFCFEHFRVAFWTSCVEHNAHATLRAILTEEQMNNVEFWWGRAHCNVNYRDFSSTKPLDKYFGAQQLRFITMLDDTPEKITGAQFGHNYLQVRSFTDPHVQNDGELLRLMSVLSDTLLAPGTPLVHE